MPYCAAKNCKNTSTQNIKMCSFPKENEVQTVWINNIGRNNWQPKKDSRLCEVHFDDDQWEKVRIDGTKKLKWKAIPTIFGEAAQIRTEMIQNNNCQQKVSIQEENLPTISTESTNQVNTNTVEISELPQNNNVEEECKEEQNKKAELALNPKTFLEYKQRLERMEKLWLQSQRSRRGINIQLQKIKIKLKRLQQDVRTVKAINKLFNKDQIKLLTIYKKNAALV
ncbi:uncharacterized protein [Temnothorax nylanderi]|uniref:uncharacterized protein n=1 Tax=Temnothorax nylanderi TaxID=102681 RepID=UPI003A89A67F